MTASFTAYIDESGDEGFVFHPEERGSSRWLVLSAVVFRKSNDLQAVQIMREARALLKKEPKRALHFRELKHEQRVPYVRLIGAATLRTVSVLIHKPSIKEPERFQSESFRLYRYASRLLLERVSWLCRDHHKDGEGDGTVEITFSNRSAMSYDDLRKYLGHLTGLRVEVLAGRLRDVGARVASSRRVQSLQMKMQTPGSSIPPLRAAAVADDLYTPCACLRGRV